MKYEFCPGDTVVIRDWDDMEDEFGLTRGGAINCDLKFIPDMRRFCGVEMEVKQVRIDRLGRTHVEFVSPLDSMNAHVFSADMIRPCDIADTSEIDISGFMSIIEP